MTFEPTSAPPPVIATIGMHGSASTWVFNVIREMVTAKVGQDRALSVYADTLEALPNASELKDKHLVIKSHHGSMGMDNWLTAQGIPVVMSVRDPRDACLSMASRFNAPLQHAVKWIEHDCERLSRLAPQGYLVLRYEDRFFESLESIYRLMEYAGIQVEPATISGIFAAYTTEAVRAFAQNLRELPPDRVAVVGTFEMDRLTQILAPHIGDGRSGKWRALPAQVQVQLTQRFARFLEQFDYAL